MAIRLTLILVALFLDAKLVLAERAWVLWLKDSYTEIDSNPWRRMLRDVGLSSSKKTNVTTSWQLDGAYPQFAPCEQALVEKWKDIEQSFSKFPRSKLAINDIERRPNKSVSARFKDGDSWTISVFCLPDTFDPRISK